MENEPIINNNKYKKLVLNTSSELKFTKIKSTFLCSEAKKISKENISKYFYLGNKINNNNNEIYTLKVIYHDKTFENEIKYLSSYNEFYSILAPLKEFSHISKLKTALYNDENVIIIIIIFFFLFFYYFYFFFIIFIFLYLFIYYSIYFIYYISFSSCTKNNKYNQKEC